jgi:hypothetical protein
MFRFLRSHLQAIHGLLHRSISSIYEILAHMRTHTALIALTPSQLDGLHKDLKVLLNMQLCAICIDLLHKTGRIAQSV